MNVINFSSIKTVSQNFKEIKAKFLSEYYKFLNIFDRVQTNKFFFHRSYNHKIELSGNRFFFQNETYRISFYKFQKIKEYLNENFFKDFIIFNKTFYFLLILFVLKFNNNLRFYVDYRKLNIMIKRNKYFFLFIEKIINKILDYKYFIRLNIIVVFNKFRIYSDNENFIIFIIVLKIYKYKILSFDLTNGFNFFQQYINEIL